MVVAMPTRVHVSRPRTVIRAASSLSIFNSRPSIHLPVAPSTFYLYRSVPFRPSLEEETPPEEPLTSIRTVNYPTWLVKVTRLLARFRVRFHRDRSVELLIVQFLSRSGMRLCFPTSDELSQISHAITR